MATNEALDMTYDHYFSDAYWRKRRSKFNIKDLGACDCLMGVWSQCGFEPSNLAAAAARVSQRYGASFVSRQCLMLLERNGLTAPVRTRAALIVTLCKDRDIRDAFFKHGVYPAVVKKVWAMVRQKGALRNSLDVTDMLGQYGP